MKRIIALLLTVVFFSTFLGCRKNNNDVFSSGNTSSDTVSVPQNTFNPLYEFRKSYNLGNNKVLEGDITVDCFFVNDNESSWNVNWANWYVTTQIKHALEFLTEEAAEYGKTVNFMPEYYIDCSTSDLALNSSYSMKYDGIIDNDASDGSGTKNILEKLAANMGYPNAFELGGSLSWETETEHIFLIFVNKTGRSYSFSTGESDDYFSEHSLIFAYDFSRPIENGIPSGYTSLTIAHEILHTYGADDYYTPEKRNELAKQYYPNDVMLKIEPPTNLGDIGDLTAFQIGWTNTVPDICYNSDWWH